MSESHSTPPQKKRRLSDGDSDQITRSKYWFEDGNVVLQTENTLFRVHRSILSRHSEVFKDTFAMPQPPSEANECIEGCPVTVVPLSDTAEDMNNMISFLYDLVSLNCLSTIRLFFFIFINVERMLEFGKSLLSKVVRSMLRLGRKYVITCLENEALRCLHHDFPTTLEEWDSSEDRQITDGDNKVPTVLIVISIAHEFGLSTILPAAYAKYLEYQFLVRRPVIRTLWFLIISPIRRKSQMIPAYLWKHANGALLGTPELWDISRRPARMHSVLP